MSASDFVLDAGGANAGRVRLRTVVKPRFTEWGEAVAEVRDGAVVLPDDAILMAVIHRHAQGAGDAGARRAARLEHAGAARWRPSSRMTSHNLVVFGRDPADWPRRRMR